MASSLSSSSSPPPPPPPPPSTQPTIQLDPREQLLQKCLVDCAQTLKQPPLEIRFAGGWVRDKLLGQQSDDIDAALSTMSGKDFGQIFLDFYAERGQMYKEMAVKMGISDRLGRDGDGDGDGKSAMEPSKIVVVEEDADKSKHLAVAKMKLFGLEVDLVNLRTEVYAADSRTPLRMEIGTAEEDALRRDATINALFYNLHTNRVEDLTGKGLDDLRQGIMRTPLDPYQTFRDDPLRVLRLIRFASRLDFEIDPAAKEVMRDPAIRQALKLKISRERVRAEIIKAFEGPRPSTALLCIHDVGLFTACFARPTDDDDDNDAGSLTTTTTTTTPPPPPPPPPHLLAQIPQTCNNLNTILKDEVINSHLQLKRDSPSLPWLLAAYTPWAPYPAEHATHAIKEGMKATVREVKILSAAVANRSEISALVSTIASATWQQQQDLATTIKSSPSTLPTRGKIAMAIRRWSGASSLSLPWNLQVLYALLCDLDLQLTSQRNPDTVLKGYSTFLLHISHLKLLLPPRGDTRATTLDNITSIKPLLNGRQIIGILDKQKSGPGNKLATELVLRWQFDHPLMDSSVDADAEGRGQGKGTKHELANVEEECARWLKKKRGLILAFEEQQRQCDGRRRKGGESFIDLKLEDEIYEAELEPETELNLRG